IVLGYSFTLSSEIWTVGCFHRHMHEPTPPDKSWQLVASTDFVQSVGSSTSLKRRRCMSSRYAPSVFRFSCLLFFWSLKHWQAHQQAKEPTMSTRIEASMGPPSRGVEYRI